MITDLELGDLGSDLDNLADSFMTGDEREASCTELVLTPMAVGVAHAAVEHLDLDVMVRDVWSRNVEGSVLAAFFFDTPGNLWVFPFLAFRNGGGLGLHV